MSKRRNLVLVGHCGPDVILLSTAVNRLVPEAAIHVVRDPEGLASHLTPESVLLVNRVLDGAFTTTSGIELIQEVLERDAPPVTILVSDLAEAQANAEAVGARPGFGKRQLYDERTGRILRDAVASERAA